MNVSSTLHSTVSLLAIDQQVLLEGSGHDITKDFVFDQELLKYEQTPDGSFYDPALPFWFIKYSYQWRFINVGAVIITNAKQEIPCKSNFTEYSMVLSTDPVVTGATYSTSSPVSFPPILTTRSVERKFFETFLFKTLGVETAVDEGNIRGAEFLHENAPDAASSWVITGIAVSDEFGLGLTTSPAVLSTFLLFYIDFNIPSSIKIGEVMQLEFLIVNLFDVGLTAAVKFFNDGQKFEAIRPFVYNWSNVDGGHFQIVELKKRSVYRFRYELRPRVVGFIELKVSAASSTAGDSVTRQLLVLPEGFPTFENHAELVFLDECDTDGKKMNFSCSIPAETLNGTVQVRASVTGDILGPALLNLESLIRLPMGCGEQTMITFVPNILALDYLTSSSSDLLTSKLNETAKAYLDKAYQRMLKYRHADGSFSAFGSSDKSGSTWLTAFVAKYFRQAQKYIEIDDQVIVKALEFVASKQEPNGQFREDGIVFHKSLQSGTGSGVAFSSYIAVVFQENVNRYPQFKQNIQKAISYVYENYDANDVYSSALATHLLYQADDVNKDFLLSQLLLKATRTPKYVYWKNLPPSTIVSSLDIEITAYGLLIVDAIPQLYQDGFKILHWLISQQNSKGGFQSTQDTIVGLEAISKFASKFSSAKNDLTVDLYPDFGPDISTTVNATTSLMTQQFLLEQTVRNLDVSVMGKGFAIVQLSCSYFLNQTIANPGFDLSLTFGNESCDNKLVLNICASFLSNQPFDASNMAIFTIHFPSGFTFDPDTPLSPEIKASL